ncbi:MULTISPECIES: DUF3301 domain-containing protein [unclassified Oleiphilus]|uniref:DUF3301 domain-containing protein n=1 Tax=unclassified Oleiphilus TaxID=2631174 RepID=UPI0007C365B4|nr:MULTISPECIES: DUF3301 domain-containing protein [unclassified Oleiphilus]KZY73845.1 hypothetical protein A3740_00340 [Oleiphilus sp. HI0068]KZY79992.1 hypothetical protein A3741_06075 [Oleiphilus sp. HI0069]KZY85883.1 hypothetical protein A3743_18290 [Oleiphilus sp. HI0072]KZZ10933.1 hypothetical protein A3749_10085 [Oleiphilus sp. HI0078]KZZ19892.1 hypothetical protein A3752_13180 [Oleiphilus sp. HI0081]KZZ46323.1 hypothetical protein A3755_18830 [Oleiphilus sp. HI0085]
MSLRSLVLTLLVCLIVWYWLKARELKDIALRAAAKHCRELDLSILDQTVVLRSLKLKRGNAGRLQIIREYGFEFSSTGEDRYKGSVKMAGARVQGVKLAPHRVE